MKGLTMLRSFIADMRLRARVRARIRLVHQVIAVVISALVLAIAIPSAAFAAGVSPVIVLAAADGGPELEIPVIPLAVLTLLQIVSPYIVSIFAAITWAPNVKKAVAIIVSFVVALGLLLLSVAIGWIPADFSPLGWVMLCLYGLGIQQAAYGIFLKGSADVVMKNVGFNKAS